MIVALLSVCVKVQCSSACCSTKYEGSDEMMEAWEVTRSLAVVGERRRFLLFFEQSSAKWRKDRSPAFTKDGRNAWLLNKKRRLYRCRWQKTKKDIENLMWDCLKKGGLAALRRARIRIRSSARFQKLWISNESFVTGWIRSTSSRSEVFLGNVFCLKFNYLGRR